MAKAGLSAGVDTLPENPWAEWALTKRVAVAFSGDSSAEVYTQFDTGQMVNTIQAVTIAWEVYAITVSPSSVDDVPDSAVNASINFQMLIGDQTGEQERTHASVFAGLLIHNGVAGATGANANIWPVPMDIYRPLPLVANRMTALMHADVNVAGLQSKTWVFTFWYSLFPADVGAVIVYLKSTGQI
jgi:hypothetical protein